jgi:hypothetical protein
MIDSRKILSHIISVVFSFSAEENKQLLKKIIKRKFEISSF